LPDLIVQKLWQDFALKPVIATEIEFYLHGAGATFAPSDILTLIRTRCANAGLKLASAEQERGPEQYEISLLPTGDIAKLIADTERFKTLMDEVFRPLGVQADFAAKPLIDAPGSGLHIHVHLEDAEGKNVFFRKDDSWSQPLLHAIGGMLKLMNESMMFFAPSAASYARFTEKSNAPTTVSWGANNRTVAIRLPTKPMEHKHIEHRVAGSDADVGQVITAILAGMHYGLEQKCEPGEPIYGDASLPQYGLPKLMQHPPFPPLPEKD